MDREVTQETGNKHASSQFLKTDGGKTTSNKIEIPSIALPKGGGAIKGIDEKFSVNAVNGTASFAVQLPFSPARGDVSPSLNLSYSSGGGNSVFGLGWSLSLPSIKRKTDNELPKYFDETESDTYLFSEAEDLVPEFKKISGDFPSGFEMDEEGNYKFKELYPPHSPDPNYAVRFYRPRIEGLFARIEKWTNITSGEIKWRVMTKDNITTLFGWSEASRISDPEDPNRIFEWKPEFVFDDKGNCAHYVYKKEDAEGFEKLLLHHRNKIREGTITYTNLYLEKVLYGNKTPYKHLNDTYPDENDYMFQTVFDYGEYEEKAPFQKIKNWKFRKDAFSEYRAGFEVRTTRRCERVLLFHYFTQLSGGSALVKSLDFGYDTSSSEDFTFLSGITTRGYIKKTDGTYTEKSLPPMAFQYQKHDWNKEVKEIPLDELTHAPIGLNEPLYQLTDLYSEGLPGILTEQAGALFYKRNLGKGQFEQAKLVSPKPSFAGVGSRLQLMDLDGDGSKQLVSMSSNPKGYFELDDEESWKPFKAFEYTLNLLLEDPNLRMVDINRDGKQDILITDDNEFCCYQSLGKKGFESAYKTAKPWDEEEGPHLLFSDVKQSIFLADMSGDGLSDLIRIRNGEICYWPNLGYGRFGAKVGMDHAPVFDNDHSFDPSYLRLADIDGSGTTDIVYLGKNRFSCWMNLSGNAWGAAPFEIDPFPEIHDQSEITVADLLGNGVACIVWSSPLPKDSAVPLKYIDLMNSKKPHIMNFYKNNLGKEVMLTYTPSTQFYSDDKREGKPWITKLPFPVHCVSKTETRDKISGYRFVSEYKYHHGYYDHLEKEFRGFGMVEQIDAEDFEHWAKGEASNIVDKALHQEPVITKSWFHTGAFLGRENILNHFAGDYWYKEMERQGYDVIHHEAILSDASIIASPGLDADVTDYLEAQEWREALRACKGMGLRSETFAQDAPTENASLEELKRQLTPFSVASHSSIIELIQPKGRNKHAVFVVKERETITYSYERRPDDPRIAHNLNIKLDEYGNVLESASVVYPRIKTDASLPPEIQAAQAKTLITYTQNTLTNDIDEQMAYLLRLPAEAKTYELQGVEKQEQYYRPVEFETVLSAAEEAAYHEVNKKPALGMPLRRLIENVRTIYRSNNLKDALPLGKLESLALPFESYQLAYPDALLEDIFAAKVDESLMLEGRFIRREGDGWWIRSGTREYMDVEEARVDAQNRFYLPLAYIDPYGTKTTVKYDDYHLFAEETTDVLGNKTQVDLFNFRTLSPQRMRDINHNLSEVISDEFGLVKAMAVLGKGSEADDLLGLDAYSTQFEKDLIADFFRADDSNDLISMGKALLQHATVRFVYDFDAYMNTGQPAVTAAIAREEHYRKNNDSPIQLSFEYTNGMGEVVIQKAQAEPGLAKQVTVNADNTYSTAEVDTAALTPKQLRWIGSGRTVRNNKGNAVKQYEPYFSVTHQYEDLKELVETGVTPVKFYDALGRLIKTELPDGTLSRVTFNAWQQALYDQNDTILESSWYQDRSDRLIDAQLIADGKDPTKEKAAADQAAKHSHTPAIQHLDTLGRPILSIEHNRHVTAGEDEFYLTRAELDSEGNLRKVIDARGNTVMQYQYDMLGNQVYQKSMDAGQRWLLVNVRGNPLRTWDERQHEFQYFYDILHRPLYSRVIGGDVDLPLNHIFDRKFYGESEPNPEAKNLRGQVIKNYDTGGVIAVPEYDFKGQPKSTIRMLFKDYKGIVNWEDANLLNHLETERFVVTTETDALGRMTKQTVPDGSVILPAYNEAGLLNRERVQHANLAVTADYIKDIDYNEKGQRNQIICANGVVTKFYYDAQTFRLKRLKSQRQNGEPLQDVYYTYDPVGNITHIEDKNIPVIFFDNQKIEGVSTYTYDALYRLAAATGRENNTPLAFDNKDNWNDNAFIKSYNAGDPMAIRNYTQSYFYDQVGNILRMKHQATGNSWIRDYRYASANNRLESTQVGIQIYTYAQHPQHGYITAMPHLADIGWNFKEEMVKTIRQRRTDGGTAQTTYYQYDGQGQRIRKITENQADSSVTPTKKDERIYIGGYELYRQHSGADAGLERTSLSLLDRGHRFVMIDTETNPAMSDDPEQTVRYQLHNHLGSAVLELDDTAQVISYEEYHPYGTTAFQAKNAAIKCAAKRYRYTGMERDEESGLEYHSARYYVPWLGRWLSADPAGLKDGPNLFNYCYGNPLNRTDIKGMGWELTWKFWQWEPIKFTKEEIAPSARVFSGNVVGFFHAIVGHDTDRELGPDQAAGYEWAQSTFRWQKFKAVQKVRDDIVNNPYAAKIVGGALGLMSGFVPGAPEGDDLPESMQYHYKMFNFASTNATMIVSLKPSRSNPFTPPRAPAMVTNSGYLVKTPPSALATPAPGPFAMAMSMAASGSGGGPDSKAPSKKGLPTSTPNKIVTKAQQRLEIEQAMKEYLESGGKITKIHSSPHLHHLLPRELKAFFEKAGIDIEKYKVWLNPEKHLKDVHGGAAGGGLWNLTWKEFFETTSNPTQIQIMDKLTQMRKSFGI